MTDAPSSKPVACDHVILYGMDYANQPREIARCLYCEIERLTRVAVAAKNLVAGARDYDLRHASVDEPSLALLESALEGAGYGMSEEASDG